MSNRTDAPKAFISYSWSSVDHENWVIDLSERLMSNGVNVILDKWDLKEGHDKYAFMEKMVTDPKVSKVLIICDKVYQEKANRRKGGVGAESQIISKEIYEKVNQEKFIPIVAEYDKDNKPYLPVYLQNRIYIDLSHDNKFHDEYEKLLRNIFNKPSVKKPPVGSPPSYLFDKEPIKLKTSHLFEDLKSAILNEKKHYRGLIIDFLDEYITALEESRISYEENENSIDEKIYNNIEKLMPFRDHFIEFSKFIASYLDEDLIYKDIRGFFEKSIKLIYPPKGINSYSKWWFDDYKFILYELFLYYNSILLKLDRIDKIQITLDDYYFYSNEINNDLYRSYAIFSGYLQALDSLRNDRLKLNRLSVTADLMKKRANSSFIPFNEIMQTEAILTLRSILNYKERYDHWSPKTLIYSHYNNHKFDLFIKAKSKKNFEILKKIIKVNSKEELLQRYQEAYKKYQLFELGIGHERIHLDQIMNFEELATI